MPTYCLSYRKHAGNIGSKEAIITNKVIRQKSRCANCMSDKSKLFKTKTLQRK